MVHLFCVFWNIPKTALDLYVVGLSSPFLHFWRNLPYSENSPDFTRVFPFSPKVIFDPQKMHSIFRVKSGFDQDGSQIHLHLPACSVKAATDGYMRVLLHRVKLSAFSSDLKFVFCPVIYWVRWHFVGFEDLVPFTFFWWNSFYTVAAIPRKWLNANHP